jgi:hypothetical protein
MPYRLNIVKAVVPPQADIYINECCWGGDVIRDHLLPTIEAHYDDIQTEQEDWGWFIWFKEGTSSLAVDIVCDDPVVGCFHICLTESKRRFLVLDSIVDGPPLEALRERVCASLTSWVSACEVCLICQT